MPASAGGALDPMQTLTPRSLGSNVFRNTAGRTLVDPRLMSSVSTRVIISLGQSTIGGTENSTYTITNPTKIDNLNVEDGGVYRAQDCLLGHVLYDAGGCWITRFADKVIADGTYQRIILVPIAIGGASVADWAKLPSEGALYQRLRAALHRCVALGYTPEMTDIFWQQGESDRVAGTSAPDYQLRLQSIIDAVRSEGFSNRWFVSQCSHFQSVQSAAIRTAQGNVVNGEDVFSLGNSDSITDAGRWDTTHFNATGANTRAELAKAAYYAA